MKRIYFLLFYSIAVYVQCLLNEDDNAKKRCILSLDMLGQEPLEYCGATQCHFLMHFLLLAMLLRFMIMAKKKTEEYITNRMDINKMSQQKKVV